jgi:hypothetical protein
VARLTKALPPDRCFAASACIPGITGGKTTVGKTRVNLSFIMGYIAISGWGVVQQIERSKCWGWSRFDDITRMIEGI